MLSPDQEANWGRTTVNARFRAEFVKKKAVLAAVCTGIPKKKTPIAWLESGGHAQLWRNILKLKIYC